MMMLDANGDIKFISDHKLLFLPLAYISVERIS